MPRIKGQSTAEHIAKVAGELFYRHGIHAIGIDRIAEVANVTKRTVYKHFASKDDLVAAGLRAGGMRFVGQSGTPVERMLAVFDQLAQWVSEPDFRGCPFVNAFLEIADRRHPARAVVHEAKARRCAWFRDRLTEMGAIDPDTVAEQLMVLFDGAIATSTVRGPRAALAARALVATVLDASAHGEPVRSPPRRLGSDVAQAR